MKTDNLFDAVRAELKLGSLGYNTLYKIESQFKADGRAEEAYRCHIGKYCAYPDCKCPDMPISSPLKPISESKGGTGKKVFKVLEDLIFTASKLWDEVKPIKDGPGMTVTHPVIEEAKELLSSLRSESKGEIGEATTETCKFLAKLFTLRQNVNPEFDFDIRDEWTRVYEENKRTGFVNADFIATEFLFNKLLSSLRSSEPETNKNNSHE